MNFKLKFLCLLISVTGFQFVSTGTELFLTLTNNSSQNINVINNSNDPDDDFNGYEIGRKAKADLEIELDEGGVLKLRIQNNEGHKITDLNVTYRPSNNKNILKYYVPCAGPLTGLGCSWDEVGNLELNKFISKKSRTVIPFFSSSRIDLSLNIIDSRQKDNVMDCDMEMTLFALPSDAEVKKIELDSTGSESLDMEDASFDLTGRGVEPKSSLAPVIYKNRNSQSRWVDMILHNYTSSTFIFYALKKCPGDKHIKFEYKNEKFRNSIIYYPPFFQMRGPGFKFTVTRESDGNYSLSPKTDDKNKDKYYIVLGKRINTKSNKIAYIPLKIKTDISLGSSLEGGVNILSQENTALVVEFKPVNCGFKIERTDPSAMKNMIRIPINDQGNKEFDLQPMENIQLSVLPQNISSGVIQKRRCAAVYEVSGVIPGSKKRISYKIILTSPPFLNANTPGVYYPGGMIEADYEIGNYIRYPIHLYLTPVDNNGYDADITLKGSVTDLPDDLIGSFDYFISDKIDSSSD